MSLATDSIALATIPDHTRRLFDLVAFDRCDGGPCTVPVHVIAGSGSRPRLVAVAGVHGDEPDGILALLEASRCISPRSLRGRLVLVPIANPPAFATGQRRSPVDGLDLNRTFPGSPTGLPSERLAHRLFQEVIRGADFVFTLHSWYAAGTVLPFVEVPEGRSDVALRSLAAARASGFERIRLTAWPAGLLVRVANESGVPGMEAEIGDTGASRPANQRRCVRHLRALLHHLGMSDAHRPVDAPANLFRGQHVRADRAGVLSMVVPLGAAVPVNGLIAGVRDLHGRPVGEIRSPVAGTLVSRRSYASVAAGDIVATMFSRVDDDPASCSAGP